MNSDFANKLALVTGAGRGVGRAVAIGLATQGARVLATDLDGDRVAQLARSLRADGLWCEGRALDVGDADAVEMWVDELELTRPIELLANVAGTFDEGVLGAPDAQAWRKTFRVHTDGVFHVSRSVARRMKARKDGAIVIVGAHAACVPRVQAAAYAASKAAAHMFAKCLAHELAEHGVRCSVLGQSVPDGPQPGNGVFSVMSGFGAALPLRPIRGAEDVAEAVLHLLSQRAPAPNALLHREWLTVAR
jgi:2,3-dihydro-2,3-dihydroxybenzoate dehydrogenase